MKLNQPLLAITGAAAVLVGTGLGLFACAAAVHALGGADHLSNSGFYLAVGIAAVYSIMVNIIATANHDSRPAACISCSAE
jgi:hypothetical protein